MKTPRRMSGASGGKQLLVAAARPVEIHAAVFAINEAGIHRRCERRVVELDRQVRLVRLRLAFPRRADLHRASKDAIVRALVLVLRDWDDLDLDVEGQGVERAVEAVFLLAKSADSRHEVFLSVYKVAPIAALSVNRKATDGLAASPATAATTEDREARRFWCARKAALAAGENRCSRPVAAQDPR